MEVENKYKGSTPSKDKMLLVGHLVLATDHLLEASVSNPQEAEKYVRQAKLLDELRVEVMGSLSLGEELWCAFKHLSACRVLSQELFKIDGIEERYISDLNTPLVELFGKEYEACGACKQDKSEVVNGD